MQVGLRSAVLLGSARPKVAAFSLAAFMADQADGCWFDFRQTDRLFQENVGPTPADDPNEVIGLALDQRMWAGRTFAQQLAAAPNLLTAGAWITSVGGGTSTATESPAGTLTLVPDGTNAARADQSFPTTPGRVYRLQAVSSASSCNVQIGTNQGGSQIFSASFPLAVIFVATTATTWIRFTRTSAATVILSDVSAKEVTRYAAVQATAGLKPKVQAAGGAFDGADDVLLTGSLAGAGSNFIVARVVAPATMNGVNRIVAGTAAAATSQRWFLGFDQNGLAAAGVGGNNPSIIKGATDFRGQEVVIGISQDGTTVRLFSPAGLEYEAAQSSSVTTGFPLMLGAYNGGGSANGFFNGSIKSVIAGRQFLDLATFNQIAAAL